MNKSIIKNNKVPSTSPLKISYQKKRKLEILDQKQVNFCSSDTNDEAHEFVKQCKEIVFQQTDDECLQTFKEIGQLGKITYLLFFHSFLLVTHA